MPRNKHGELIWSKMNKIGKLLAVILMSEMHDLPEYIAKIAAEVKAVNVGVTIGHNEINVWKLLQTGFLSLIKIMQKIKTSKIRKRFETTSSLERLFDF